MADVASLSFDVDSSPLAQASSRLDQLGQSAQAAGSKSSQLQSAADALVAALNRSTAATEALTAQLGQVQAAGTRTSQAIQQVGATAGAATSNVVQLGNAAGSARAGFDAAAAAAGRLRTAWAELGAQGAATLQNLERMQRLAASSASTPGFMPANTNVRPISQSGHGGGGNDYRNMILNDIMFQGKDFVEQAISGGGVGRAALTQAPQVAALMQMGNLSGSDVLTGLMGKVANGVTGVASFVAGLSPATLALGVLGTAALGAGAALSSYRDQQKSLEVSVAGRGRASGATVGDINRVALAGAQGAGVSVGSARDMVADYAETGRVGTEMYAGLLKAAQDYAVTTRQELPDANKALAAAFADPAKGAEQLNAQLGFLDADNKELIESLQQSGDRLGAQKVLLDALGTSLLSARDRLGFFAKQWQDFKNTTSGEFDAVGRAVERFGGGGTTDQRIDDLQKILNTPPTWLESFSSTRGALQDELNKLLAEQSRTAADGNRAQQAQRSLEIDPLIKGANPGNEQLQRLERSAANIKQYFNENWIDPSGEAGATMRGFEMAAKRMREDMAQGGAELAASLRRAQFDASQVGRSPLGRSSAEVTFNAAEERRRVEAMNLEPRDRNAQMNAIATRENIQQGTISREATISETQRSGLLNRVPANLRQYYVDAAKETGVPLDFLVATSYMESGGFKVNASPGVAGSHAYGLMQLQPGTARELGVDPNDPRQNVLGGAKYLKQQLDRANGDEALAYGYYHDGPNSSGDSAAARKGYAAIQRFRNMPTTGQDIQVEAQRSDQLDQEKTKLEILNKYRDQDAQGMDAATRAAAMLMEARQRGVAIDADYIKSVDSVAQGLARSAAAIRNTNADISLKFDDAQLGRDRYTSQAYSSARSLYGDTDSPDAQNYISRKRGQLEVQDTKSTLQDATTGFVEALSKGTSAASAFSSALSKIGDKLISGAIDSLFSSAFRGVSTSGGLGGLLGGLLPSGGLFANGGIMTSRGPVQLRTYANGGVANSPQLAVYGEGSSPEAYVPLPDGKRIPVAMQAPANGNAPVAGTGGPAQFNIYAPGSTMTPEQYMGLTRQAIAENNQQQRRTQYQRAAIDRRQFG